MKPRIGCVVRTPVTLRTGLITGLLLFLISAHAAPARAEPFSSGSTGADGAFEPTASTEVDLSLAGTGPGTGVYDVAAGAVVFNYTTIKIPAGVGITFKNHPHNPPVVWLASGDAIISGSVRLDGGAGHAGDVPADYRQAGPGGFPGGLGGGLWAHVATAGLGPGGGLPGAIAGRGGYRLAGGGGLGGSIYGNSLIQPLIGGSGGGGSSYYDAVTAGGGGGGGGGAILIASSGVITLWSTASITAYGGPSARVNSVRVSGAGSGGAIRLVANDIIGNPGLYAVGGAPDYLHSGRIRLETNDRPGLANFRGNCTPAPSVGRPGPLFPTQAFPTLRAKMVADQAVPADPAGNVLAEPDITIDSSEPVTVTLEATNIPPGTIVRIRVAGEQADVVLVDSTPLEGTPQFSTSTAQVTFPSGLSHVTLNAAYELGGQAGGRPRETTEQPKDGIASIAQPSQAPIRGVFTVNGQPVRRVEVTSNGDPSSTRVVYHPENDRPATANASPSAAPRGKSPQRAASTVIKAAVSGAAELLANAHRMLAEFAAVSARTVRSGRVPASPVSAATVRPGSADEPTSISRSETTGASIRLASFTGGARVDSARSGFAAASVGPNPEPRTVDQGAVPTLRASPRALGSSNTDPVYAYDRVGNRLTMTDPTGVSRYTYDAADRLTSITNPSGHVIAVEYDRVGRRTRMVYPNGVVTAYTYDKAGRVTRINAVGPAGVVTDFQYTYDPAGNRLSMTTPAGEHRYSYDGLYQLIAATHPEPENPPEFFEYDPAGNRLRSHLSAVHVHDAANRLLEDQQHIYTYDANGNQTSRTKKDAAGQPTGERFAFIYNADNQMIGARRFAAAADESPAMTAEYIYDGLGRRLAKIVDGIVTEYVYDNEDILLELQGPVGQPRRIVARYTHGPGIDEPLIMERDTNADGTLDASYFYHADALGTIHAMTDVSGTAVQIYAYDSFGQILAQTGIIPNSYRYTARECDAETGLYYYRARYYDAALGRFTGEDPIRLNGGSLNFHTYVGNSPINANDPHGLISPLYVCFWALVIIADPNGNPFPPYKGIRIAVRLICRYQPAPPSPECAAPAPSPVAPAPAPAPPYSPVVPPPGGAPPRGGQGRYCYGRTCYYW